MKRILIFVTVIFLCNVLIEVCICRYIYKYPVASAFSLLTLCYGENDWSNEDLLYHLNVLRFGTELSKQRTEDTYVWLLEYERRHASGIIHMYAELNMMLQIYPWLRSRMEASENGRKLLEGVREWGESSQSLLFGHTEIKVIKSN